MGRWFGENLVDGHIYKMAQVKYEERDTYPLHLHVLLGQFGAFSGTHFFAHILMDHKGMLVILWVVIKVNLMTHLVSFVELLLESSEGHGLKDRSWMERVTWMWLRT